MLLRLDRRLIGGLVPALLAVSITAAVQFSGVFAADAGEAPKGYLGGVVADFAVPPPPPPGSAADQMDLVSVRAMKADVGTDGARDADADARAYMAPIILPRFQEAAGTPLVPAERPILTRLLDEVIQEAGGVAARAKKAHPRQRPYVGNADIKPCNATGLDGQASYPSGHAMNGYVVAQILAEVFPQRTQNVLARGILYGDRRVVCGVHYPLDVQQGRMLAIAYIAAVKANPRFQSDLACAKHEDAVARKVEAALPEMCRK